MELTLGFAAVIGIAPAMILMYAVLKRYTYPATDRPFFNDPTFFGLFVVGMIAGTIVFSVYTYFWGNTFTNAILFAVLEAMIILVVLNLRRFHGKSDTLFYGYGMGLGFGATMSMGMTYYLITIVTNAGGTVGALDYLILIIMAISKTMMLSTVGLNIGEGVARLRLIEFTAQAIFFNMVYQLVMVPWFIYSEQLYGYLALVAGLVIAAIYFYKTTSKDIPKVIRDVLRQEGQKRNDIPK
ncbi:MAG TPA: hypothetical protein VJX93_04955 [Candidatus Methanomethylophilaceae archaeon]|nr:hypothetical protein [Candidatus Methanomethylophilaceae archaeon]